MKILFSSLQLEKVAFLGGETVYVEKRDKVDTLDLTLVKNLLIPLLYYIGYTGNQCEQEYNECVSSPCANGGTCTDRVGGFSCSCGRGFTGNTCQLKVCALCTSPYNFQASFL